MKPKTIWSRFNYWGKRLLFVVAVAGSCSTCFQWLNARAENQVAQKQALAKVPKLEASIEDCQNRDESLSAEIGRVKLSVCTMGIEMRAGFKSILGERTYKAAVRRESGDR
jgi:hypothetical protein